MKYFDFLIPKLRALQYLSAIVLCAAAIVACGNTQPSCIDASATTLVKQIVEESLQKEISGTSNDTVFFDRIRKGIQIAVKNIRTSKKDDTIGKVTCDASLEVTVENAGEIARDPAFRSLQNTEHRFASVETGGPVWKADIQYTAQKTEDTKNLVVELSGHMPMVHLLSALSQAGVMEPKLPLGQIPADLLASGNAREAAARMMNQIYGAQDPRHGCWMLTFEETPFCMKIAQSEIKVLAGERHLYAIATGQGIDQNGETITTHALQGLVGAFIVGEKNGRSAFVAQSTRIQAGTMGAAPHEWTLMKLGANDNWGWQGQYSDCHQGYCGSRMIILANRAGTVGEVGNLPTEYDDTGACSDDACTEKSSTLRSTVTVGKLPGNSEFFDLLVTVTGTSNGEMLEEKVWTLQFNSAKHAYVAPSDWPFADRDF